MQLVKFIVTAGADPAPMTPPKPPPEMAAVLPLKVQPETFIVDPGVALKATPADWLAPLPLKVQFDTV